MTEARSMVSIVVVAGYMLDCCCVVKIPWM